MTDLWDSAAPESLRHSLESYDDVVARQGVSRLPDLDRWYRDELPHAIATRRPAHVTLPELARLTEWKMARGVWRARNLVLVRSNEPDAVVETSTDALSRIPHPTQPIAVLATLKGVGPATASAVTAAFAPEIYPFFDELVAAQLPELGKVAWTLGYYTRYAAALRDRAGQLGHGWTPVMLERALWAHVGGKAGAA
ncbi:MAG TPA: hypothetical protein VIQ74_03120 [Gemmatimonadaceae bacterium]